VALSLTRRLCREMDRHLASPDAAPVTVSVAPAELRRRLSRYDFSAPLDPGAVFDDVAEMLQRWTEHAAHPMHFGLFRPGAHPAAVIAEALVALHDPNLATWEFSPAANEIERHVLRFLAARLGLDPDASAAHFTSGGQEANHTAVSVALTHAFPDVAGSGLRGLPGAPVLYVSGEGHHSFEKVAHQTGLGRDARRTVPVTPDLRLDVEALARRLAEDRRAGLLPFMVVGTAGTTNAGVVDPLPELADLCAAEGLWLHVDAAWGGAAALSERLRPVLAGIERADSITFDAHKWLSVPVGAGMLFCRHPGAVRDTFRVDAAYVPDSAGAGRFAPLASSMQWSRRCTGLKLFMPLAELGLPGVARLIEHQAEMGDLLRRRLRDAGWTLLNETPLPVVCFTSPAIRSGATTPAAVVDALRARGEAWISKTLLAGRIPALRACIANFATGPEHLDALVRALERAARGSGEAAR